jgi:hypothetical protein
MALVLTDFLRDNLADEITASIDVSPPGSLIFETSGDAEVATCVFNNPSFGASSSGIITMGTSPTPSDADAAGGTIAQFSIFDGAAQKQLEGTVTGISGGGDIEITSLVIVADEQVDLTSLTITVPTGP